MQERVSGAERTREALLKAGLRLFGEKGFNATSTRELAAAAGANIGSIAYHFGGKEGLHIACAEYITVEIGGVAYQALGDVAADETMPASRDEARAMLVKGVGAMAGFITGRPEAAEIVQFVMRELMHPSAALDLIYSRLFEPVHIRLCGLWAAATGEPAESEEVKLAVFTMIGQLVYFRIGHEAVIRRMGWTETGPDQTRAIAQTAIGNLNAILDARGRAAQ